MLDFFTWRKSMVCLAPTFLASPKIDPAMFLRLFISFYARKWEHLLELSSKQGCPGMHELEKNKKQGWRSNNVCKSASSVPKCRIKSALLSMVMKKPFPICVAANTFGTRGIALLNRPPRWVRPRSKPNVNKPGSTPESPNKLNGISQLAKLPRRKLVMCPDCPLLPLVVLTTLGGDVPFVITESSTGTNVDLTWNVSTSRICTVMTLSLSMTVKMTPCPTLVD